MIWWEHQLGASTESEQQYQYFRVWWFSTRRIGGLREGFLYVVGVVIVVVVGGY